MTFDISRFTFDPWKDYQGVVMEQGRVQTDSDWNEWLAEVSRRIQAGTLDLMGQAVYPQTTPDAFLISTTTSGGANSLSIGCGRMYVDGLLAENHGFASTAQWDPALAELSGAPQPPPAPSTGETIDYSKQPYFDGTPLPAAVGQYVAYLDVWQRPIVYLQDNTLVDKAIGIDTSGRIQTVWQVRLLPFAQGATWTCATPNSQIPYPAESSGLLSTNVIPNPASGPCCLTTNTGYTGVENQLYRVELHNGGSPGDPANPTGATFKWSRDNASVATLVTNIAGATNSLGAPAWSLTALSLGRDQVLGFAPGNWIELLDDTLELAGKPGEMYQIDSIDVSAKTITLTSLPASSTFTTGPTPATTRIRRWDQSGLVYEQDGKTVWFDLNGPGGGGVIPVPASDTTLILEDGVIVNFGLAAATGQFNVGDFWIFSARTADGKVDVLTSARPLGVHHHYAKLAIVTWPAGGATDCRNPWPPGGASACGCCCSVTVGAGAQFATIQAAINSLPDAGGEVCILAGRYPEYVEIDGKRDIVIHGCGAETRIVSPASQPGGAGGAAPPSTAAGLSGVVTVGSSEHVRLSDLCVEAADGECGILLDRISTDDSTSTSVGKRDQIIFYARSRPSDIDVTLCDLVVTASTRPGILANDVDRLEIADNRVAMKNVFSQWPAIFVSGQELRIERNWVGLQSALDRLIWLPGSVAGDLKDAAKDSTSQLAAEAFAAFRGLEAPGGIQIGGPSLDVLVVDNRVEGGARNGVTLGSLALLDANGGETSTLVGIVVGARDDCCTTISNGVPGTTGTSGGGQTVVAGGPLVNIVIERNYIRDMGLCGIGPVGFFDLSKTSEVVSIENLSILGNTIERTLLSPLATPQSATSGYGAICVPDVKALRIYDNTITDFGFSPGAANAWGIFLLLGELVDISRNRVIESRDFALSAAPSEKTEAGGRGGIAIVGAAPPTFPAAAVFGAWASPGLAQSEGASFVPAAAAPMFEPGLPALRIARNFVRVPVGLALEAVGFGPFSIVDNHFSAGGVIPIEGLLPAMTVGVLNLGFALELAALFTRFAALYQSEARRNPSLGAGAATGTSNGTVLFANNICQFEGRGSWQTGISSVLVGSLDHVLFANNQCWFDSQLSSPWADKPQPAAFLDAIVLAMTTQVNGNRFQEAVGSVLASALTVGYINMTSLNMSTYCLLIKALAAQYRVAQGNVSWVPAETCRAIWGDLSA